MTVEVSLNHPEYPKGMEFDVSGILIENGKSVKLDDARELDFVARHKKAVKDKLGNHQHVTVTGTAKYGPTEVEKLFPEPESPVVELDEVVAPATTTTEGGIS